MKNPNVSRTIRRTCLILIALFYVISVPWYRDSEAPLRVWLGLPDWVTVAVLCYLAVAISNAIAWSVTDIEDGPAVGEEGAE